MRVKINQIHITVAHSSRIIRGGSWYDGADRARAGNRFGNVPGFRYNNLGFRPVFIATDSSTGDGEEK